MKSINLSLCLLLSGLMSPFSPAIAGDLLSSEQRQTVQNFKLDTLSGGTASLAEHRDNVVVVSFWATWCEPCKKELNDLAELIRNNSKLKDIKILAVATDAPETLPEVRKTVEKYQWPFIVPLDPDGSVMSRLNPRGATPFSIFLDRKGRKAYEHEGYKPGDMSTYQAHLIALEAEQETRAPAVNQGTPLSHFTLPGLDGEDIGTETFIDSPLIISFWATWCEPCKKELSDLTQLLKKERFKDVKVIAVATDAPETLPAVRAVVDEKSWPFFIALDSDGATMARLNPRGATPFSIFVGRGGIKLFEHEGYKPGDLPKYEAHLDALLQSSAEEDPSNTADFSYSLTNTLDTAYWHSIDGFEDKEGFVASIDRLNLQSSYIGSDSTLSSWVRVDTIVYNNAPSAERFETQVIPERLQLNYERGDWTVTGGDFYRQLGRGLLLSLRKGDEVATDIAIRGGQLQWANDSEKLSVFGGVTNPVNVDPVNMQTLEDLNDIIAGTEWITRSIPGIRAGAHSMAVVPNQDVIDTDYKDYRMGDGLWLQTGKFLERFSLYIEAAHLAKRSAGKKTQGYAGYITLDTSLGDNQLLLEGMVLDNMGIEGSRNTATQRFENYTKPPTLERIRDEVPSSTDVVGGRLAFTMPFREQGLSITLNAMTRLNNRKEINKLWEYHGYGIIEAKSSERHQRLKAEFGYRQDYSPEQDLVQKSMVHAYVDFGQGLGESMELKLTTDTEYRARPSQDPTILEWYLRGSTYLGVEDARWGSATFELGYDESESFADRAWLFYAGILSFDFWDAHQMRLTAGTQRGGLKCVAGVCRIFPAFKGAKLEWVARF